MSFLEARSPYSVSLIRGLLRDHLNRCEYEIERLRSLYDRRADAPDWPAGVGVEMSLRAEALAAIEWFETLVSGGEP